ncbi:hypothetical protein O3P69_016756 [Scylla paramamosain]|uniref:FAD dependent oxidoreductase domain-containing protein n=1 Tax=Scylla paramamosain TaxID=85552 RepID=A0AAW0T030_SCYPA
MVRVVVVGGGVNGVGSALAIQRRHPQCQVKVVAKSFTPHTTGDGAAGLWEPYLSANTPDDKVIQWSRDTFNLYSDWYRDGEGKARGVSLVHGTGLHNIQQPTPAWHTIPIGYINLSSEQRALYGPQYKSGHRFTTYTAEPSKFLPDAAGGGEDARGSPGGAQHLFPGGGGGRCRPFDQLQRPGSA